MRCLCFIHFAVRKDALKKKFGFVAPIVGVNQGNSEMFRYGKARLQPASGFPTAVP